MLMFELLFPYVLPFLRMNSTPLVATPLAKRSVAGVYINVSFRLVGSLTSTVPFLKSAEATFERESTFLPVISTVLKVFLPVKELSRGSK